MKATEEFKRTIKAYLDKRAAEDELWAETYKKPHKNIDECINYIFNEVMNSGCNGFDDAEIYGMAVHYYDEDSIKDVQPIDDARVLVNHHVELTEEEKAEARSKARKQFEDDCLREMRLRNKKVAEAQKKAAEAAKHQEKQPTQLSLFD